MVRNLFIAKKRSELASLAKHLDGSCSEIDTIDPQFTDLGNTHSGSINHPHDSIQSNRYCTVEIPKEKGLIEIIDFIV